MRKVEYGFGSTIEAVVYPILLLIVMWLVFWADHLFPDIPFYKWGVMPKTTETLKGILFMPLLHSKMEIEHIINNSLPTLILLGAIVYYYREIALRVFVISWLLTGIGLWMFAANNNSYHIGMSGVIYAMVGFLFMSGILRKHKPLQSISLFVAFVYGSLIWGVFPIEAKVSWEGHLSGLLTGVLLAIIFRKKGPQSPKYLYEIEREMGIEPPDFEGELNERIRLAELREAQRKQQLENERQGINVIYHYVPSKDGENQTIEKPSDDTEQ